MSPCRARVAELKQKLLAIDRQSTADSRAALQALADLRKDVIDVAARSEDTDGETLSLGGFLSTVSHWRQLCERHGLDAHSERCRELATVAFSEAAEDWRRTVEERRRDASVGVLFDDLLGTAQLEADIRSRGLLDSSAVQPLRDLRDSLRVSLVESLDSSGIGSAALDKLLEKWTRLLADQCDTILTTVDDLPPGDASDQIDSTITLVDWYLKDVVRRRKRKSGQLRRKLRRLRAEKQERQLQATMEKRFGRKFTGRLERCVLILICLVLVLMAIEWTTTLSPRVAFWFGVIDAAACVVFLTEFFLKLWLVRGRGRWFFRHFLIDFVPSIPVGLLTAGLADSGDLVRAGRVVRFARLPRFVRYVRILRPIVRIARAFGLVARGIDRLARRYGHVLNVNVILHPTRTEQELFEKERRRERRDLDELRQMLRESWARRFAEAPEEERVTVADLRISTLKDTLENRVILFEEGTRAGTGTRDIPAEALLDRMESLETALVIPALGEPVTAHLARIIRVLAVAPLRWLPLIRKCIPPQARLMTEAEVVSETSRRTARFLRKFHDAWFWVTDLYGTVTPSQFVDRVGGILVKSSFRPAYRLLVFGGFLLLTETVLHIVSVDALEPIRQFLKRFVGTTVLVLGGVCFIVLALGWWLQRVAREATEFYEKSVQAQFLHLMDSIRPRQIQRDSVILYERVLAADWPEEDSRDVNGRAQVLAQRLNGALSSGDELDEFLSLVPFVERLQLLYHDWLDGAMFTTSDTRATNQLLGNTALSQLMLMSDRLSKKEMKTLFQVDLENQKALLNGPYLWFQFISQSVSHSVARLLVDYNRRAVPSHELKHFSAEDAAEFEEWLDVETETQRDIPPPPSPDMPAAAAAKIVVSEGYLTTAFTALHFLDTDPVRDGMIEEHFGSEVATRLRKDRSLLIRRTFGTFPLHMKPRGQRVVNLYAFYEGWIAGGRIFFVPWFLFVAGCQAFGKLVVWIYRSVQEIRHPERRRNPLDAAQADFRVAVRKIGRVRSPVAEKCIRLRAMFDPAWLGVPLPGEDSVIPGSGLSTGDAASADVAFLRLGPSVDQKIDQEQRRCRAGMRWLDLALATGLMERCAESLGLASESFDTRQHLRAAGVAVHADLLGVRTHLFAREILEEVLQTTTEKPSRLDRLIPRPKLWSTFQKYCDAEGLLSEDARRAAWKAVLRNERGCAAALRAWGKYGDDVEAEGERRLSELLLHPGRITEQLLTLRTIQTMTVLDVLHYREHVFELGEYKDGAEFIQLSGATV